MKSSLVRGLSLNYEITVTEDMAVKFFPENISPVYSTPAMIWHMEEAARMAIMPHLDEGEGSVGISVNVKHLAATPLGMKVVAKATLTEINGRVCSFKVESFDEKEKVGEGTHERFVIDLERFAKRLESKEEFLMNTKRLKERYVIDENGNRVEVILHIKDYRKLLEELEELESIRAYDAAKASGDEAISFEQAVADIEKDRR